MMPPDPLGRRAAAPRYNIRAVERLTGVPAPTIRSWERRYGFPTPERTATARRLYSEQDVAVIRWVKQETGRGTAVGQALQWAREYLAEEPPAAASPSVGAVGAEALIVALLAAVARFDEGAAEAALNQAFAQFAPDMALTAVVQPALVEIGERWARAELPVSAEHFASHLVRRRLLALLAAQPAPSEAPAVVLACVAGEHHELGLLILAIFLRWQGLRPVYLGADVPVGDVQRCLRDTHAPLVCLSAVNPPSVESLRETVRLLQAGGEAATIVVGGPAAVALPGTEHRAGEPRAAASAIAALLRAGPRAGGAPTQGADDARLQ